MKFKFKIMGTIEQASATCRCVLLFFIFATYSQASIPNFTQADFAYSGDHRVEVYTHGPDLSGTLGGAGGIGGILADFRPQTSDLRFFHADAMGNIVLTTDSSGETTSTHRYTPFGRPITSTGSYQPRFGSSSKEYDRETGMNSYGYRYLAVYQGRWLNRDPIGEDGGINLYQHSLNSPLIYIDPHGDIPVVIPLAIAAGAWIFGPDIANAPGPGEPTYPSTGSVDTMANVGIAVGGGAVVRAASPLAGRAVAKCLNAAPSGIRFGQKGVSSSFRHGEFAGRSIDDVAVGLRNGTISPNQLPIQTVTRDGVQIAVNNRSLLALRKAGLEPTIIKNVTGNPFFEKQITQRLGEMGGAVADDFIPVIRVGGQ